MESPDSSSLVSAATESAPSSRACQNCVRAKTKCVPQADHQKCSRCSRLKKECIVMPKVQRKKRSPNQKTTAQLEEKIESLVNLLAATQGVKNGQEKQGSTETFAQANQQEDVPKLDHHQHVHLCCGLPFAPLGNPPSWNPMQKQATVTTFSIPTPISIASEPRSAPSIEIPFKDPDRLLQTFREYYTTDYPFIIIPSDVNAQQLQATRPWVAMTINMIATNQNRNQQLAMARQVVMEFATALLIRCERSLDLLEALIFYNLWQYYYAMGSPQNQSMATMQLAIALLYDLGLNKPLRENDGSGMMPDAAELTPDITKEIQRTPAERRAYLSVFIISSLTSCGMRKIEGLESSPYLEYNCQLLLDSAELQSDQVLVFIAKAQNLVRSMSRSLQHSLLSGPTDIRAPLSMQAKLAKADLQDYFLALPPELHQHRDVQIAYNCAEIYFYEPALYRSVVPSNQNAQRLDMLWACTVATKASLDNFLTIPVSNFNSISVVNLYQMGHAMSIAFKLSFIEVPGWDLPQARATLDLLKYLNHIIYHFAEIGNQIDSSQSTPSRRSFCTGGSVVGARIRASYEARLAAEADKRQQEEKSSGQMAVEEILAGERFDYFDDSYLMSDWRWEEMVGDFMQA